MKHLFPLALSAIFATTALYAQSDVQKKADEVFKKLGEIYAKAPLEYEFEGTMTVNMGYKMKGKMNGHGTYLSQNKHYNEMNMSMEIVGGHPSQGMPSEMKISMKQVASGEYFWQEMNMPVMGMQQVIKFKTETLQKFMAKQTGINFSQGGPMDPKSMAEMYKKLFQFDSAETVDGKTILKGKLKDNLSNIAQIKQMDIESIIFTVNQEKIFPMTIEMHTSKPDEPFTKFTFVHVKHLKEKDLPNDKFVYTPPEGMQVMDGDEMLQAMSQGQ